MKRALLVLVLAIPAGLFATNSPVIGNLPDNGPSLPAKCNIGQIYFQTAAGGGGVGLYGCTALNTWSGPYGSGGGGGGISTINGDNTANQLIVAGLGISVTNPVAGTTTITKISYVAALSSNTTWTIAAATHGLGTTPFLGSLVDAGGHKEDPQTFDVDGSGNVTITVAVAAAYTVELSN